MILIPPIDAQASPANISIQSPAAAASTSTRIVARLAAVGTESSLEIQSCEHPSVQQSGNKVAIHPSLAEDIARLKSSGRLAQLHSKVMRRAATNDEFKEYRHLRTARTADVRARTVLADYAEIKRLAQIEQTIEELKRLFRPIPK